MVDNSGWIPCSDRLPEKNGWYLCSCEYEFGYMVITQYWNSDKKRWVNNAVKHIFNTYYVISPFSGERLKYKDNGTYDFNESIIAWMPLPKPWKKRGSKNEQ